MGKFHLIDRDIAFRQPLPMQEWLPEGHPARHVVDVVERLDLNGMERAYAGKGSTAYHPALVLSLLVYGYATGCYSIRKIEQATYDSLAFRYIACNRHPDHDTLANFRKRFGKEFEAAFVEVLQVARENRLSRFGRVSLDGTKIHANTSRHSALSYGHAEVIEAQLKAEVQKLLALAAEADGANVPDGMSVPAELQRREDRLAAIATAKGKIEARAAERFAREQGEYEAKLAAREAKAKASGKKPGGKAPKPPEPGPRAKDQINLTDEESRIMVVAGGGFKQSYNGQAIVDTETMLVMVPQVTQAANDKQQVVPMVEKLQALPEGLNQPEQLLADIKSVLGFRQFLTRGLGSYRRLEAVLKATGHASGLTAGEIGAFAEAMEASTLVTAEAVQDAASVLATFRSVSGDTFTRALSLAQDLATVFGQDLASTATQLGKALEDPAQGLTALRRVGISFTESERELITSLAETGRTAEAQRLILDALEKQVGGGGAAEAGGLTGATNRLGDAWGNLLEAIGRTPVIASIAQGALNILSSAIEGITGTIEDDPIGARIDAAKNRLLRAKEDLARIDVGGAGTPMLGQRFATEEQRQRVAALEAEVAALTRIAEEAATAAEAEKARVEAGRKAGELQEPRAIRQRVTWVTNVKALVAAADIGGGNDKDLKSLSPPMPTYFTRIRCQPAAAQELLDIPAQVCPFLHPSFSFMVIPVKDCRVDSDLGFTHSQDPEMAGAPADRCWGTLRVPTKR